MPGSVEIVNRRILYGGYKGYKMSTLPQTVDPFLLDACSLWFLQTSSCLEIPVI